MPAFTSRIDPNSASFAANRKDMLALVDELRSLGSRAASTSEKRRPRFEERGQLTPRERLARLLDPGMPFLEMWGLANYLVDDPNPATSIPGANSIAGIGYIRGTRCMVFIDDSGIAAGSYTTKTWDKISGCMDIALEKKMPFVHSVESAGANLLQYKVEGWAFGGAMFYRLGLLSAAGIPTIALLHGPSTAGGAYMPGMSDYCIAVKDRGMAALAGAALLKAATGEEADDADLGGAEMHATKSGVVEYLADDDAHAMSMARDLVAGLGWNKHRQLPEDFYNDFLPPRHSPDELAGAVPTDYRVPYDVHEVMTRLVDDSQLDDFKPRYGATLVCTRASIHGFRCAIIGNNGPIDPAGATKCGQFLQLCDQAQLPVIFLNNITGYMVGTEYEQAGMIKHGAKMIQAVSNIRVPRIALYIGASFGAGNYGMSGIGYNPDFLFAWPNAKTGVMGGEQAAKTMTQVARQVAKRKGIAVDEEQLAARHQQIVELFDSQSDAFYTSGRGLDMGVIDPRDSRNVLAIALSSCEEAKYRSVQENSFGVARM